MTKKEKEVLDNFYDRVSSRYFEILENDDLEGYEGELALYKAKTWVLLELKREFVKLNNEVGA